MSHYHRVDVSQTQIGSVIVKSETPLNRSDIEQLWDELMEDMDGRWESNDAAINTIHPISEQKALKEGIGIVVPKI